MAKSPKTIETEIETPTDQQTPPAVFVAPDLHGDTIAMGAAQFSVRKRVLVPTLDFPVGAAIVCRFMEAIHRGEQAIEHKPGKVRMEPGMCATVSSLTGEHRVLWTPAVLARTLTETYPNDGYVGGWFHIVRLPQKTSAAGTPYNNFTITEIEAPTQAQIAHYHRAEQAALMAPSADKPL